MGAGTGRMGGVEAGGRPPHPAGLDVGTCGARVGRVPADPLPARPAAARQPSHQHPARPEHMAVRAGRRTVLAVPGRTFGIVHEVPSKPLTRNYRASIECIFDGDRSYSRIWPGSFGPDGGYSAPGPAERALPGFA